MPSYVLLPSQPLQTTIRSLRRSIGCPIRPTSEEGFPPSATHIILTRPTPCLALFAAIVDPSLNLVDTDNRPYHLPTHTLPASDTLIWAGAVKLSARAVWCQSGPPLQGLRISTLGALRPRGAGTAAPSTEVIRVLVSRAGAVVTDSSPDIVLVAPGMSRKGARVRKLLEDDILCLGAGFVVDLLLRVQADPREYVAFPEQKHLCGHVLDEAFARSGRPLPVSKAVSERAQRAEAVHVNVRVKPADVRRSKRINKGKERNASESDGSVPEPPSPVLTNHADTPPEKMDTTENTGDADEISKETVPIPKPAKPSDTKHQRKRPRRTTSKGSSAHSRDLQKRASSPSSDEPVQSKSPSSALTSPPKELRKETGTQSSKDSHDVHQQSSHLPTEEAVHSKRTHSHAPSLKRPRQKTPKEINRTSTALQNEISPAPPTKPKKRVPQPHDLISPTTPAQNPPKRPRLSNSVIQEASPIRDSGCRSRPPLTSLSDADTLPPRQLHFPPEDANCDTLLPTAPFSRGPPSPTGSIISGRVDGESFSVDEGFRFLFACLGQPSQADVDRLLRCIKNGGDIDDDDEDQYHEQGENNMDTCMGGANHRSYPLGAESPLFDEEDDVFPAFHRMYQPERTTDETLATSGEIGVAPLRQKPSRSETIKRETVDAFRIPIPRQRKILSNVILPEMALLEHANEVIITEGHEVDDQTCQDSVDCMDWILGAENLVGISRDAARSPHKGPTVARCRRLWTNIFEADALQRFAAPDGLSDSHIRTLMGVCIRLLLSGLADDMKVALSEKLLVVRDEQARGGFDSLQTVLSSRLVDDLPLRHKALGAIWTSLVQSSIKSSDFTGAWEILNGALIPRIDGVLNRDKFKELTRPYQLEKELTVALQSAILASYMFSTRLDFTLGEGTDESDQEESNLHPENWSLICRCMDKLCEVASSPEHRSMVLLMSTSFLRIVAINIGGKVWLVTDKVVASASKMVAKLSSLNGKNCFCVSLPMIVNQFRSLADDSDSCTRLSAKLKTICDYLFFLGWLYTVRGKGNPMKRAMTVIRSASSFTRSKPGCSDASSRSINHHVGLLLTVADSLAGSGKDGEYLLCKMLTSKCPRPNSIAERLLIRVGEQDTCWRATLQAISKRCDVLLARQESVHVYTDWLSQNLVETLCLLRRSSERRSTNLSEKEALRAQDSVFCGLAMLMISSLTQVNKSAIKCSRPKDDTLGHSPFREAVEKPATLISTCMKVSGDIIAQIRSNPEESISKNRHGLLCALLSLADSQILLVRNLLAPSVSDKPNSKDCNSDAQVLDDCPLSFLTDNGTENVILNVIGGGQLVGDEITIRNTMRTAAGMLANFIELRSIHSSQTMHGQDEDLTKLLQLANMDVTNSCEEEHQRGMPMKAVHPWVEDRCRLVFWSQAVRSNWIVSFLEQRGRAHVMCISAVVSSLASVTDDWDTEDRAAVMRLCADCAKLEALKYVFEPMQRDVSRLDNSDYPLARVETVETALRLLVKHWPVAQVRSLLKLLSSRLKQITGSKSSIQPEALILYSFTQAVSAQLGGFTNARFLHAPLSDISQAVGRMTNSARDHSKTFHLVQSRVLSALCMTTSDMETRVLVLRIANAFPASDTLPGFWGAPLLPTDEVGEAWTRRAEKYAEEWRGFVFTGVVEDPLFAGRNVAYVVRRLATAVKGGDAMRRLVQGILVRGRGKLDWLLRRDGRAWRDWSALCEDLLEA